MAVVDSALHLLPAGTTLNNKYEIVCSLGEGGFGITYKGHNKVLNVPVAIKEYYPHGYANRSVAYDLNVTITDTTRNLYFSKWKEKFLKEAKTLAKFSNISNIVNVLDYFEENNTAYIVMEYLDGITLSNHISKNGVFDAAELCRIIIPMLKSLNKIHQEKLIHRDISPDNIMMMPDGSLKLYDFGATVDYSEDNKTLSVILKPGFAPIEQYLSHGNQGPWTDVYAACATIYFCITGTKPDPSVDRIHSDELKRPSEFGIRINPKVETAILMGMSIKAEDRFKNAEALASALESAISATEQNVPPKPAVKPLHGWKKTVSSKNHTEIAHPEIEISEEDPEKKTTFLEKMNKIASKLNIWIVAGVPLGILIFVLILLGNIIDNELHQGINTGSSKSEYSAIDPNTHQYSFEPITCSTPSYNFSFSMPNAKDYLNTSSILDKNSSFDFSSAIKNHSMPNISLSEVTPSAIPPLSLPEDILSKYNISKPDFSSFAEDYLTSKENEDLKKLSGTWNGTTYISDYFGFQCALDSNWFIMTNGSFGASDMSDEEIKKALDSGKSVTVMTALNIGNVGKGSNVSINVENTEITDPISGKYITSGMYFAIEPAIIKSRLETLYLVDVDVSVIDVNFCGENTRGIVSIFEKDGSTSYQIQVPIFKGKYMASILYSTSSQQDAEEFIKRFSKS